MALHHAMPALSCLGRSVVRCSLLLPLIVAGCSSSTPDAPRAPIAAEPAATPLFDAAVGISEVQARRELDAMFREAGMRILNDERLLEANAEANGAPIEVVLDGYDPERRIGYEYIADGEVAASPSREALLAAASGDRILVVGACSLEQLRRAASSFLAETMAADAGS